MNKSITEQPLKPPPYHLTTPHLNVNCFLSELKMCSNNMIIYFMVFLVTTASHNQGHDNIKQSLKKQRCKSHGRV